MHTQRAHGIGLLAFGIVAATALILSGDGGGARGATTTVGRAATSLNRNAGMDEIDNRIAGQEATQDFSYHLPENPVMRSRR
jgi:hypothetical protein